MMSVRGYACIEMIRKLKELANIIKQKENDKIFMVELAEPDSIQFRIAKTLI